jgi:hypothetical protein
MFKRITESFSRRQKTKQQVAGKPALVDCLENRTLFAAVPIDLSAYANFRIQNAGYSSAQYPSGDLTLGGVPFSIPSTGNNG